MDALNRRIDIQTCRDHHLLLTDLLAQLPQAEPLDEIAVVPLLGRIRTILTRHLRLEDQWLYPRLAQSGNADLCERALRYQREMGGIRAAFETFYAAWSERGAVSANPSGFLAAAAMIFAKVAERIDAEDHDLYPAAEHAMADAGGTQTA